MINRWVPVGDRRLSSDEARRLTGHDLWLCLADPTGYRTVLSGYHLSGVSEGFFLNSGRPAPEAGTVTHYWIRDFKPPLPDEWAQYDEYDDD